MLCTGSSCRSQMAEAFLRKYHSERFEVHSAGTEPKEKVHPLAVEAMLEMGIDITQQKPKPLSDYLGRLPVRHVLIVCDKANKTCPRIWPGAGAHEPLGLAAIESAGADAVDVDVVRGEVDGHVAGHRDDRSLGGMVVDRGALAARIWFSMSCSGVPWGTAGGDYTTLLSSIPGVSAAGSYTWVSTPAFVATVQMR